jgi:hypothetical protein
MQQTPLRVVMSRDGGDANHEAFREIHGVILSEPHVGDPATIYFENGRCLVTSPIKRVAEADNEWIVETANSTYRIHPDTN